MPTNTSLTINSIDANGKKVTDKISYVNPNITNQQALTLAQAINNLTNNHYISTTQTDTRNLDDFIPKPKRNIDKIYCRKNPSGGSFMNNPNSDTPSIDIKVSEMYFYNNVSVAQISVYTLLQVIPSITDVQSSDGSIWTPGFVGVNAGGGDPYFSCSLTCDQLISAPMTLTFTLHFDESPTYAERNSRITVNIVADE